MLYVKHAKYILTVNHWKILCNDNIPPVRIDIKLSSKISILQADNTFFLTRLLIKNTLPFYTSGTKVIEFCQEEYNSRGDSQPDVSGFPEAARHLHRNPWDMGSPTTDMYWYGSVVEHYGSLLHGRAGSLTYPCSNQWLLSYQKIHTIAGKF